MSEDLPNGGHVALPRRLPLAAALAAVAVVVTAAFGLGGWAYALQRTQTEHTRRLDEGDARWKTVHAYMCMDCARKKGRDCTEICGTGKGP